jgi:enolase-phosphatase E1
MAVVSIPGQRITLYDESAIVRYLAGIGIDFERLPVADPLSISNPLTAQIEALKASKGYSVVDEINVTATTPGLADMLARFDREHWHDEDEVRFVLEGRRVFHIRLKHGDVVSIEVEPGDLIRVPEGTRHWFTLTPEKRIRAVRFFHNPSGWLPHYPAESITTRAVLLDIEGTVCPIHFASRCLFPYAYSRIEGWLGEHSGDAEVQRLIDEFRRECPDFPGDASAIAGYVRELIAADSKSTALKELQGRIWHDAWERGEFVSPVFPDVARALRRWNEFGAVVAIYSSGSTTAQRDFFRYTSEGDLSNWIGGYFDTRYGPKRDVGSYRRIAEAMAVQPDGILFVSDVAAELEAASVAGMTAMLAVREGNPRQNTEGHRTIQTFDELIVHQTS